MCSCASKYHYYFNDAWKYRRCFPFRHRRTRKITPFHALETRFNAFIMKKKKKKKEKNMARRALIDRSGIIIFLIKKKKKLGTSLNNLQSFFSPFPTFSPQFPRPPLISCSSFHVCQGQWQDIKVGTASRLQTVNIRWCSSLARNEQVEPTRSDNLEPFSENASVLGVLLSSRKLRYQRLSEMVFQFFRTRKLFRYLHYWFFFYLLGNKRLERKNARIKWYYIFHTLYEHDFLLEIYWESC